MLVSPFRWKNICKGFEDAERDCPCCGARMRRLKTEIVPVYGSVMQGRPVKRQGFAFCPGCGYMWEEDKGE